jgi:hypothetical protein
VEKEEAIREVFSGINEQTGRIEKPVKLEIEREEQKWKLKEQLALELLDKEEEAERQGYSKQVKSKVESKIIEEVTKQYQRERTANNTMFSEEEINKYEQMREKKAGAGTEEE